MRQVHIAAFGVAMTGLLIVAGGLTSPPRPTADHDTAIAGGVGADVITGHVSGTIDGGSMNGPMYWGTEDGVRAFSIGSVSCNVGDEPLDWYDFGTPTPTRHPVIAQNVYRYRVVDGHGRFEQIGMSWLKHGFCALQQEWCGTCTPIGPGCQDQLGIGCSDPYDPFINGIQLNLGPRSDVNPATGEIINWPFTQPSTDSVLNGRVRIDDADLEPALNPDARYFAEIQYVAQDDAAAGNDTNNASYRECQVAQPNNVLPYVGDTVRESPAIRAWAAIDPLVTIVDVDIEGDGRFHVACRVTDNGDGTWHYEYAVHNMNSDRAGQALEIPAAACVEVSNIDHHVLPHHSGEIYDTADWSGLRTPTEVRWSSVAWDVNPLANALRWGTMFSFRFDAGSGPVEGEATLVLFKPGSPETAAIPILVPGGPAPLSADCGDGGDGSVDVVDLLAMLGQWGQAGPCDIAPDGGDGVVGIQDVLELLGQWGQDPCG